MSLRVSGPLAAAGLLAGSVLLLILALWLAGDPGAGRDEATDSPFLPGLREQVNELAAVDVIGPGGETVATLRRSGERWRVRERYDHEADFATVRDLLRALAEARIVEARTASSQWYPRLGLEAIEQPDAGGLALRFPDAGIPGIIIGSPAGAHGGHHVRREGEEQSWLIDRTLVVEDNPVDWLERSVMDIPSEEIDQVVIRHPDGGVVQVNSTGLPETPFVLNRIPAGYQVREAWRVDEVADGLASIRLEDVRPHDRVPDDAVRALFTTRDGLNFIASVFADDEDYWVHFRVSAESPATGGDDEPGPEESDRLTGAVAVDARLSPWQYRVTEAKYDQLTTGLDDLLVGES